MKMGSKGCGTKKYANGGKKKSKTVTVSPSGNYKTVVKSTSKNGATKNKVTNRRTLKGVLSGAPSQKKLENMTAPTSKGSKINMPIAPAPRPLIPSNLKSTTPLPNPFKLKKRKDSVNTGSKVSISSKLGPVASGLNKLAKGGKMKTKKYEMGGLSQQCDPRDGSCKTVRKAGLLKRWVQNAQNRRLSNFKKKKFNR